MMQYPATLVLALFVTISLIPLFRTLALKLNVVDMPDPRKVHQCPMPKIGGVAMAIGGLLPALYVQAWSSFSVAILMGSGIIVLFGFIDDVTDLGYRKKFLAQLVAASLVVFLGGVEIRSLGMLLPEGILLPEYVAIPLTLLVIVGVTNAINLADGLDGLAGGISLFSFLCIGYLAFQSENSEIALITAAICGAIFGFLRFNTHPATVFMGDAGSQLLGFLAVTLSLAVTQSCAVLSPVLPLLLIGFPIIDTIAVMTERLLKGHSPFVADKNHFHHKLMRIGLHHAEAVAMIYLLQAALVTVAIQLRFHSDWLLLGLYLIFSFVILVGFRQAEASGWKLTRSQIFESSVKGRLKEWLATHVLIKVVFRSLLVLFPVVVIFSCIVPRQFSVSHAWLGSASLLVLALNWIFKHPLNKTVCQAIFMILAVMMAYFTKNYTQLWVQETYLQGIFGGFFLLLLLFAVLTLRLTRRKKGFGVTTFDFIILFVAMVIPNLPNVVDQSYHLGMATAKVLVLFLCYEVVSGELRGQKRYMEFTTIMALIVITIRGFSGI